MGEKENFMAGHGGNFKLDDANVFDPEPASFRSHDAQYRYPNQRHVWIPPPSHQYSPGTNWGYIYTRAARPHWLNHHNAH